MKKITLLFTATALFFGTINAKPVASAVAKTVAENFYSQTYKSCGNCTLTLTYTESDASGQPIYYAFNVDNNRGFVLVSAEDAGRPIIGYSNTGTYVVPEAGTNMNYWMKKRKKEIINVRSHKLNATVEITGEWNAYITNSSYKQTHISHNATGTFPSSTSFLAQTTWNQSPNYNALCPGGSVTGCVATAMAQIMRFWSYPARGLSSSSYCDCTAGGFSQNYGTLSANYGNTVYNWANMPLSISGTNNDIATLMYDAGVSVNMDYAPAGSGAWVISADNPVCAQNSYVNYFGYNPSTINGFYDSTMTDTMLVDTLKNEMNSGRPVEYAGWDSSAGGHTWVCDGYDATDNFHMNWGWGGQDNGWFVLTNLNPSPYKFTEGDECVIGIEPRSTLANFNASPTFGCSGLTTTFTDLSKTSGTLNSWSWRFPGGNPSVSSSQNPSVTYSAPGTYNVTETVTSSVGIDSITLIAYVTNEVPSSLPLAQDFESTTFPPVNWQISNSANHATIWSQYVGTGGYGKSNNCMYYNNCTGGIMYQRDQMYTALVDYTGDANPYMYFDVAYEPYGMQSGVYYSDTLAVYYSTDCGTTWNNVYLKGGMTLCTTGGTASANVDTAGGGGCFLPAANHWRTDTISIPALANKPSVMYSFENRSGYGSNLYVDNINLPKSPLGINNIINRSSVTIYPNPSNGVFTIDMNNITGKQQLQVYNVLGQQVYANTLSESKTQINLQQPTGVYLYRILSLNGKTLSEGKLIVK